MSAFGGKVGLITMAIEANEAAWKDRLPPPGFLSLGDRPLSHSTAKEASSGQSKERIGNGHASNRLVVAPSRTAKETSSLFFLSRNSSLRD
jgi:hypothetical protein